MLQTEWDSRIGKERKADKRLHENKFKFSETRFSRTKKKEKLQSGVEKKNKS